MRRHHIVGLAAALVSASPCVASETAAVRPMAIGLPTVTPPGFSDLCRRSPADCRMDVDTPVLNRVVQGAERPWAQMTWSMRAAPAFNRSPGTIDQIGDDDHLHSPSRSGGADPRTGWTGLILQQPDRATPGSRPTFATSELEALLQAPAISQSLKPQLSAPEDRDDDIKPFGTGRFKKAAYPLPSRSDVRLWRSLGPLTMPAIATGLEFASVRTEPPRPAEVNAQPRMANQPVALGRASGQAASIADPLSILTTVNRRINREIRRSTDQTAFGRADYWTRPTGPGARGDCEDYALAKRQALIDQGLSASDLSLAIVRTRRQETHAVLLVKTSHGEYVLDNLTPWVVPWTEAPYEWIERQRPGHPMEWVSVGAAQHVPARRIELAIVLRISAR